MQHFISELDGRAQDSCCARKKKSSETHMTDIRAISVVLPRCIVIITMLTSTTSSDADH